MLTAGAAVGGGIGCGRSVSAIEGGGVAGGLEETAISSSLGFSTIFSGGGVALAGAGVSVFSSDFGGGVDEGALAKVTAAFRGVSCGFGAGFKTTSVSSALGATLGAGLGIA